jgi:hypothetical protein
VEDALATCPIEAVEGRDLGFLLDVDRRARAFSENWVRTRAQ